MTTITPTGPSPSSTAVKRHPIRGALWGVLLGLGLALLLIGMKVIVVGTIMPFLVFAGGVVLGAVWGAFGPAKAPKGRPPTHPSADVRTDVLSPAPPPPPDIPLRVDEHEAVSVDVAPPPDEPRPDEPAPDEQTPTT